MSSNIFEAAVDLLCFAFSTLSRAQYSDSSNEITFKQFNNNISLMRKTRFSRVSNQNQALLIRWAKKSAVRRGSNEFTLNYSFRPSLKMWILDMPALDMFQFVPRSSLSLHPSPPKKSSR